MKSLTKIFLVFLFISTCGFAQGLDISGYLKFFAHPNLNSPYKFDHLGTRLQTNFSYNLGDFADFRSTLDFNYEATKVPGLFNEARSKGMTIYPVEAYIDLYWDKLDLRIGKQFIFWGKTDWINPTDNLNPWDYQNIGAEIEDYRIAVTAVKSNLYLGNYTIEGIWLLHFLPDKIPNGIPDKMGSLNVNMLPAELPQNKLGNTEFAFKISSEIANIDYSLSFFHGFDKNPTYIFNFAPAPNPHLEYQQKYLPVNILGGDFITTFHKFAFKGEAAYYFTKDKNGDNIFIENPHLKYVLGVDYNFTGKLKFSLQFIQDILFKYDPAKEKEGWEKLHNPFPDIKSKSASSLSTVVNYSIGDFTSFQLIGVLNFKNLDYFILPILNYGLADGLNIYAGATLFGGPSKSPFGRSKKGKRAFLEIKYSFTL